MEAVLEHIAHLAHNARHRARPHAAANVAQVVVAHEDVDPHTLGTAGFHPICLVGKGVKGAVLSGAPIVARVAQEHDAPHGQLGVAHITQQVGQDKGLFEVEVSENECRHGGLSVGAAKTKRNDCTRCRAKRQNQRNTQKAARPQQEASGLEERTAR